MKDYDVIGYAVEATIYCVDCAPRRGRSPIFASSETDTPSHCDTCAELIEETPTSDAYLYVREAVAEAIHAGRRDSVALTVWMGWIEMSGEVVERCIKRAKRNARRMQVQPLLPWPATR